MTIKELKNNLAVEMLSAAGCETSAPVQWTVLKEKGVGGFATNLAMVLAKPCGMKPRELAEKIVNGVDWAKFNVQRVEIGGPGFINLILPPGPYRSVVREILERKSEYGRSDLGAGQKVIVEFVSANPTGPLNVVSARAAAIGDSLVRVLKKAGFAAHAEFYVNDAGRQIQRFGASVIARAEGREVPEDGYHGEDVREIAGKLFPGGIADSEPDPEEVGRSAARLNVQKQQEVLARYRVVFDRWFRESELHARNAPEKTLERLRKREVIYEKEGATWFTGSRFGDEDRVIVTSDGRPTYLLPDIAYHLDKRDRGFDTAIDLLGPDHLDYTGRMQAAMTALGYEDFFEAIIVQQVHLVSGGERVKMSKRAGKIVTLEELVEEVGIDVARYFFLQRRTSTPLEFDLDLAREQSERNPVFYVQYAHTRICGILRQDGCPDPQAADLEALDEPEEIDLVKHLEQFEEVICRAAQSREPQKLVGYLHDLATTFHKFYTAHRVVGVDAARSSARAGLSEAARIVLVEGLNLLGVTAPERM